MDWGVRKDRCGAGGCDGREGDDFSGVRGLGGTTNGAQLEYGGR